MSYFSDWHKMGKINQQKDAFIVICFLILVLAPSILLFPQNNTLIKGIIVNEMGFPIKDVNITIRSSENGATSDENGNFTLPVPEKSSVILTFSHVNYEKLERSVGINNREEIILSIVLKEKKYNLDDVVVTGTLTEKYLKNTPVRTEIITSEELRKNGFLKLSDALNEQPGLTVINDAHGRGIQVQGMDPDYTLILIDGDPVIGRTTGILELSRFDVENLKQIEIVKGPSSSLYGSEALAGVINLITEDPTKPLEVFLKSVYGTHNTLDLSGNGKFIYNNLSGALYLSALSSDGYKLNPSSISLTAPKYRAYTIAPNLTYQALNNFSINLSARIYLEEQENTAEVISGAENLLLDGKDDLTDWNGSLSFDNNFSPSFKTKTKFYVTRYSTNSVLTYQNGGGNYETTKFEQFLYRGEILGNYIYSGSAFSSFGFGYDIGKVNADYIIDNSKTANSYYVFLQHEWAPGKVFDFVAGARFDSHSDFSSRLSPKFSFLITPFEQLKIRGSVGSGFKAPDFQQLYLNFTNPQVGYTALGSANLAASFNELMEEGQIAQVLIDPSNIGKLKAENSLAFNLGFDYSLTNYLSVSANIFRNNVRDLIDTSPIAIKNNGQSVFTYFNLNSVYTQGIEGEIRIDLLQNFTISVGYQYLDAKDQDVLDKIDAGEIFTAEPSGRIRRAVRADYGGLFNRSKNSGVITLSYSNANLGFSSGLTGIIRDKYGYGDINGNGILDDEREYVKGYAVWNFTAAQNILKNLSANLRVENLFEKTNPQFIPSLSGRVIYAGIRLEFSK
jgi:outer membrane receptor for ferrienterochelin and colicins